MPTRKLSPRRHKHRTPRHRFGVLAPVPDDVIITDGAVCDGGEYVDTRMDSWASNDAEPDYRGNKQGGNHASVSGRTDEGL